MGAVPCSEGRTPDQEMDPNNVDLVLGTCSCQPVEHGRDCSASLVSEELPSIAHDAERRAQVITTTSDLISEMEELYMDLECGIEQLNPDGLMNGFSSYQVCMGDFNFRNDVETNMPSIINHYIANTPSNPPQDGVVSFPQGHQDGPFILNSVC